MAHRILLIDSDLRTAAYVEKGLTEQGMIVEHAASAHIGLLKALDDDFEAILLERKLDGADGIRILRAIRDSGSQIPVMIVSKLTSIEDKVESLTSGADDYLVKPFAFSELLARLRLHIARTLGDVTRRRHFTLADLEIDVVARKVWRRGEAIRLQPKQFWLLTYLTQNEGRVLTQAQIRDVIWGQEQTSDCKKVAVLVNRLRRDLKDDGDPPIIKTVRGVGYRIGCA